jgi:hypothetical protein
MRVRVPYDGGGTRLHFHRLSQAVNGRSESFGIGRDGLLTAFPAAFGGLLFLQPQ